MSSITPFVKRKYMLITWFCCDGVPHVFCGLNGKPNIAVLKNC